MKTILHAALWVSLSFLVMFDSRLATCLAQGSLTPPGPPGPVMKTLSQVEPRTDVLTLPGDSGNQYIITSSGSYYLTTNIVGVGTSKNGIEILANNVTLDLNGFSVLGAPVSNQGITTATVTNLTVRNGKVSGWSNSGIITGSGSIGVLLERLTAFGNGAAGIYNSGSGEVRDCMAVGNASDGIVIFQSGGSVVNCTVNDNGSFGIFLETSAPATSSVRNCHVENNRAPGIYLAGDDSELSANLCVGNNTALYTGYGGIRVEGSNNRIENNHVAASGYSGILVGADGGTNNIIIRNSVSGNGTNNYVIATNQVAGPLISTSGTITNSNPWANFSF